MKIYVIKQNYMFPHDLAPQDRVHHTCFSTLEDAQAELKKLYESDLELHVFDLCKDMELVEDGEVVNEYTKNSYDLRDDNEDSWSSAEIVELKLMH